MVGIQLGSHRGRPLMTVGVLIVMIKEVPSSVTHRDSSGPSVEAEVPRIVIERSQLTRLS